MTDRSGDAKNKTMEDASEKQEFLNSSSAEGSSVEFLEFYLPVQVLVPRYYW
jgi:hypothetical protein